MLPALFVSHGSPMLALTPSPARDFLVGLGRLVPRPRAILVASAHWDTDRPLLTSGAANDTIHDFYGFPEALYRLRYPAPGAPELAREAADLLTRAGFKAGLDPARGLDHGAWAPLLLAYPEAAIPVVQLSLQVSLGPAHHLAVGQALQPLAAQGVLVVGSGSLTHNLAALRGARDDVEPGWVSEFAEWLYQALAEGRVDDLLDYRRLAPGGVRNHPTDEHLLPLYVALGAAGPQATSTRLHASQTHGILRMDAYRFDAAA